MGPAPFFLLGLRAHQAHAIQEIPLLGLSGVAIATALEPAVAGPGCCAHARAPFIVGRSLLRRWAG